MKTELDELDIALENFLIEQIKEEPKSANQLKKALKARRREAYWRLIDRNEVEITRDNKLKLTNANRNTGVCRDSGSGDRIDTRI